MEPRKLLFCVIAAPIEQSRTPRAIRPRPDPRSGFLRIRLVLIGRRIDGTDLDRHDAQD